MKYLRQSTASQSRSLGPFVDDTDGKTPETGLTIANTDIKLVVNGGASANKNSGGGTHRANGVYGVTFDATDTATVGEFQVSVVVSGALPVFHTFWVLEEAVYDALFAASANAFTGAAGSTKVTGVVLVDTTTTNTDMRGTDNAALASVCTEGRLAELDAANLPADVDAILVDTGTTIPATLVTIDGNVDAILVDTGTTLPATLSTIAGYIDTEMAAVVEDTGTTIPALIAALNDLDSTEVQTAAAAALTAYDPPTNAELEARTIVSANYATASALTTVDTVVDGIQTDLDNATDGLGALKTLIDAVQTAVDGLNDVAVVDIWTTALTEAYRSTGGTGTGAQLLYEILAHLGEFAISGTTKTSKKIDGTTTAKTYTLDDDTSPTSITEAT